MLFAIPIGGGIPAGVVLAQSKGIGWLAMTILYFISDVALAFVFEPLMIVMGHLAKRFQFLAQFMANLKETTNKTIAGYGPNPGPFLLVLIAFGVDPMTGRAAALAQGHSFLSGWAVAIIGDMFFFGVVMVSTIWLNSILGDGTWTAIIIMVLMLGIPALVRRFKKVNI
ncbi:hypothetical protein [Bdellovibrio svalbardensis]|uniref:Uncharacterized protein n=1 Tax=Bdellovibrio svalbardensis TaxID=2972972 RepID=A0ABT6DFX4_9BACT|nr:hypothetical protein [Bdellovibrio svalbardensis]MDG0815150.1 hypothetical protein [Bdellovibrio svalbardensis]